ncbi:MAG: flagellar motor switch protein FliN [candidate division Zixibacteria bacterium]|nr:flagellar motor switch protein FliN [candidate division Zixibacteria bacterium]
MTEENLENTSGDAQENPKEHVSQEELEKLVEQQMGDSLDDSSDQEQASEDAETAGGSEEDEIAAQMQAALDNDSDDAGLEDQNDEVQMPNMVKPAEFPNLGSGETTANTQNIDLLLDVPLPVSIELGRTQMLIEDILNLGAGSVVELNKLAGEPVDLLVNNRQIAKGEVVVVDENFGIRITELVSPQDRIK